METNFPYIPKIIGSKMYFLKGQGTTDTSVSHPHLQAKKDKLTNCTLSLKASLIQKKKKKV